MGGVNAHHRPNLFMHQANYNWKQIHLSTTHWKRIPISQLVMARLEVTRASGVMPATLSDRVSLSARATGHPALSAADRVTGHTCQYGHRLPSGAPFAVHTSLAAPASVASFAVHASLAAPASGASFAFQAPLPPGQNNSIPG